MLKWIVGSKVDHPLADPKEARALVAALPAYDAVKSLDEITRWLQSIGQAEGFKLDRIFEIARDFAVAGTVRNLRSGQLEVDVEGEGETVDAFVEAIVARRQQLARVDGVQRRRGEPRGITGFERAATG